MNLTLRVRAHASRSDLPATQIKTERKKERKNVYIYAPLTTPPTHFPRDFFFYDETNDVGNRPDTSPPLSLPGLSLALGRKGDETFKRNDASHAFGFLLDSVIQEGAVIEIRKSSYRF